jgi:dihydrofolate reductase
MSKVVMSMMVSLDGFTEGPGGPDDWSWHVFDDSMEAYANELVDSLDLMILGRLTYQMLSRFWLAQAGDFADRFNRLPKIVYSRTLDEVEGWNARKGGKSIAEEVAELKKTARKGYRVGRHHPHYHFRGSGPD